MSDTPPAIKRAGLGVLRSQQQNFTKALNKKIKNMNIEKPSDIKHKRKVDGIWIEENIEVSKIKPRPRLERISFKKVKKIVMQNFKASKKECHGYRGMATLIDSSFSKHNLSQVAARSIVLQYLNGKGYTTGSNATPPKKKKKPIKKQVKKPYSRSYGKGKTGSFYNSKEWRALRYKVIKKHDSICMVCGRTPWEHGIVIHIDHIKPRSRFPSLELDEKNCQILCEDCNMGKSNKDMIRWVDLWDDPAPKA